MNKIKILAEADLAKILNKYRFLVNVNSDFLLEEVWGIMRVIDKDLETIINEEN